MDNSVEHQRTQINTVASSVTIRHGRIHSADSPKEVVVGCVLRNASLYIPAFISHYRKLGVERFVFLDNDSDDNTVDLLSSYDEVCVLHSSLPFAQYSRAFRKFLLETCCNSGWCLLVDVDEHFLPAGSKNGNLQDCINYMLANGYETLLATQLDMFADAPLSEVHFSAEQDPLKKFPFFDVSNMKELRSGGQECLRSKTLPYMLNGIRSQLFGREFYLFKYPLVRLGESFRVESLGIHEIFCPASLADCSGVLFHYKLHSDLLRQSKEAISLGNYWNSSIEYRAYFDLISDHRNINIKQQARQPQRLGDMSILNDLSFFSSGKLPICAKS